MSGAPVIFLDIDGVLLPGRCWAARRQEQFLPSFDHVACGMVRRLCADSGAKFVISSTWRKGRSKGAMVELLIDSGLMCGAIHDDWATPEIYRGQMFDSEPFAATRAGEIEAWLAAHPEAGAYVAFDDDPSIAPLPGAVLVPFDNGIGLEHYKRARELLGLKPIVPMGLG